MGWGKGLREEARVGALFEALEHFLTGPVQFATEQMRLISAGQVAEQLAGEASAALLAQTPDEELACWRYTALRGGQELDVPVYVSCPWYAEDGSRLLRERVGDWYDYRAVGRYAINSGSAVGVTEDEAIVHALNEVIERDAFSLLVIRAFLTDGYVPTRIDPRTLPADLADLHAYVQQRVRTTVYLLDMTTELGVPSTFAYVPPTAGRPHLRGAGTSLSARYSAHRALTELLQGFLIKEHQPPTGPPHGYLEALRPHPLLYRCGQLDLTAHLDHAPGTAFTDRPSPAGLPAHLELLIATLAEHGFTPYRRQVRTLPGGVTAVHVFVPGLEHFMVICQGIPVLPGPRGRRARSAATTSYGTSPQLSRKIEAG
jgi:ribosomal protein S12 methylthiotransferase accessory factor